MSEYKLTIGKIFKHLHIVNKHRLYVFLYCCKYHIPFRGLKHDLSKYSPTEFFESARYYTGTKSPIDTCKELFGFSKAWMHHKGRNSHHYEYWQDNFDKGTKHCQMPFKDSLEMLCDYLGAARAYMGKDFSYEKEYEWFLKKIEVSQAMHPVNREFLRVILKSLTYKPKSAKEYELIRFNYKPIKATYKLISDMYARYENNKEPDRFINAIIGSYEITLEFASGFRVIRADHHDLKNYILVWFDM